MQEVKIEFKWELAWNKIKHAPKFAIDLDVVSSQVMQPSTLDRVEPRPKVGGKQKKLEIWPWEERRGRKMCLWISVRTYYHHWQELQLRKTSSLSNITTFNS